MAVKRLVKMGSILKAVMSEISSKETKFGIDFPPSWPRPPTHHYGLGGRKVADYKYDFLHY